MAETGASTIGSAGGEGSASAPMAPDFSAIAIEHLVQRGDAFRQHVREYLDRPGEGALAELVADLQRFRNTLVLLERTGAVFVVEELLALLEARRGGAADDDEALARVLIAAGERLGEHVARLGRGAGGEGALSLLPLVNDSRACRGAPLLSAALLLTAGIALPGRHAAGRAAEPVDPALRADFVATLRATRTALARDREHRDREPGGPASDGVGASVSDESLAAIGRSREACDASAFARLEPLFASLGALVTGIRDGAVEEGVATRTLLERVEWWLGEITDDDASDLPDLPRTLCRDLLCYVALIDPAGRPAVAALQARFDLGRIRPALAVAARDASGAPPEFPPGLSMDPHLAGAIRDSIDAETAGLRQWLDQAPTAADHPKVLRLRERLAQMEPVLTLLGAREARSWLRRITESLEALSDGSSASAVPGAAAPVGNAERLMLAESLIRLDRALDESGGAGVGGASTGNIPSPFDGARDSARDALVDEAVTRCLEEARRRLASIGESLDAPRLVGSPAGDAELLMVERALSLLAVVEIGPLLRGLRAVNPRIEAASPPGVRDTLATLLASLDFYLGCALRPGEDDASRRLLRDAEEALARLEERLPPAKPTSPPPERVPSSSAASVPSAGAPRPASSTARAAAIAREVLSREASPRPEPARPTAPDPSPADANDGTAALESGESGVLAREALACMDAIAELLLEVGEDGVPAEPLRRAFDALAGIQGSGRADGMRDLAAASASLLTRIVETRGGDTRLREAELALVEEAHGVLPQLIERLHGASERIRGFDELLAELREASAEPVAGPARAAMEARSGEDADDVDESTAIALDSTLQAVFRRECATHIDTLERAVRAALLTFDDPLDADATEREEARLPSEALLRALHTLSGSAQTVEARDIVAIVQPLQRVALTRQRADLSFDEGETRYVAELVEVLRARLDALENGEPVDAAVRDVETRLTAFVERALQERGGERRGGVRYEASPPLPGLDDVFDEEARELLVRMQRAIASDEPVETATDRALGHLHTLKGSARMAGRDAVAERAHALEGEVQALRDGESRRRALASGRRDLQLLLLDDSPRPPSSGEQRPAHAEAVGTDAMPAATFDSLLTLATDITVSQARLSDDIARMREACRDLESAAGRWRRLPHEASPQEARLLETPAAREMLADLDAARRDLGDALRLTDVEQQHASRAASALQQMLVRTRLVRVEELRARLAETVHDAAEDTGRRARFVLDGGEVTLDGALCRQLRAPLEHLVRNAVVHGIEPPESRREAGKEIVGTVRLSAAIDGADIVIVVEDDGAGVDRETVNRRREAAGRASVDTVDALQEVLCEAGFTTLERSSAVGGRGLGLSAVSETLSRLDGRLHIGTRSGAGTVVTCRLRQRIVVVPAVLVRCARRLYALPVSVIRRVEAKRDGTARAGTREGGSPFPDVTLDVDVYGDAAEHPDPPRLPLISLLGGAEGAGAREEGESDDTGDHESGSAALVLELDERPLVLEVDRVVGYRELLVQPLGPQLAALQRFAGGSVLPDGRQVLLIEPERLIGRRQVASGVPARSRPDPETMRPVALVVDDSITLRVAAAGMLERNGVESREARDGVEALDGLARALPDLMIVDLDMPRLGGFDLIRRMRERLGERSPPVIVISSRDGEDDRERARVLGVTRYLVKPYTEPELREALLASGLRLPDLTIA